MRSSDEDLSAMEIEEVRRERRRKRRETVDSDASEASKKSKKQPVVQLRRDWFADPEQAIRDNERGREEEASQGRPKQVSEEDRVTQTSGATSKEAEKKDKKRAGLERARELREKIRAVCLEDASKVRKDVASIILSGFDEILDIVVDVELKCARMEGENKGTAGQRKPEVKIAQNQVVAGKVANERATSDNTEATYASALAGKREGRERIRKAQGQSKERPVVLVRAEEGVEKTSKELRKEVVKEINPISEGVKVRDVRLLRQGGVAIQVANMGEAKKLAESESWGKVKMTAKVEEMKRPHVMLLDVEEGEIGEKVAREVYEMNKELMGENT